MCQSKIPYHESVTSWTTGPMSKSSKWQLATKWIQLEGPLNMHNTFYLPSKTIKLFSYVKNNLCTSVNRKIKWENLHKINLHKADIFTYEKNYLLFSSSPISDYIKIYPTKTLAKAIFSFSNIQTLPKSMKWHILPCSSSLFFSFLFLVFWIEAFKE